MCWWFNLLFFIFENLLKLYIQPLIVLWSQRPSCNYAITVTILFCVNTGSVYTGVDFCKRLCGVSVIKRYLTNSHLRNVGKRIWTMHTRGESMENALRACCKGIKIGKIFIHREGGDNGQHLFKMKFTKLGSKPDLFPSNGENTRSVCHHFLWITHLLIPII
ncbi:putative transferase [Helianthus anomalus]